MTQSQLHAEIRHALTGTNYRSFMVVVESLEAMDGGLYVEWRVTLFDASGKVAHHFRGRYPDELLAELRATLRALRATEPSELEIIGGPPTPREGAA
jgi:hypothetical protein